jgi:hypothetical protein
MHIAMYTKHKIRNKIVLKLKLNIKVEINF